MDFEILEEIINIETIAVGNSIREVARLQRVYGIGRGRKLKGITTVRLLDGTICKDEVHFGTKHMGLVKRKLKLNIF